jgi:hypothetical protein
MFHAVALNPVEIPPYKVTESLTANDNLAV